MRSIERLGRERSNILIRILASNAIFLAPALKRISVSRKSSRRGSTWRRSTCR